MCVFIYSTSIYCLSMCQECPRGASKGNYRVSVIWIPNQCIYGFQTLYVTVVVKAKVNWWSSSRGEETKMPVLSKSNFRAQDSGRTLICRFGSQVRRRGGCLLTLLPIRGPFCGSIDPWAELQ